LLGLIDLVEPTSAMPPYRVVLVEDSPDLREMFAIAFELAGFEVRRAGNAAEALDQIVADCPDILVTDLAMPGLDGFALIRRLREHAETRYLPVLAVTGQGYADTAERVAGCGGCGCVVKPCLPDELIGRARELLENCHGARVLRGQPCARLERG
jgi:DNA-binding response OmpR family regulator